MSFTPSKDRQGKKFSIAMKNIDVNLYRAYKGAMGANIEG